MGDILRGLEQMFATNHPQLTPEAIFIKTVVSSARASIEYYFEQVK